MKFDPRDFVSYDKNASFDEKLKNDILKEIASTLGNCGNKIDTAVKRQQKLLEEIQFLINIKEGNKIFYSDLKMLKTEQSKKLYKLVDEYNKNYEIASRYQYYLNVQKEALNFRGFDYDPYKILPKIKIQK